MRKFTLISAAFLLAFAGCTCGQGWRPNVLTRLHDRIHGNANMGEPCDAGCAPAAEYAPNAAGCSSCGNNASAQFGGIDEQVINDGMVIGSSSPMTYAQPVETVRPAR